MQLHVDPEDRTVRLAAGPRQLAPALVVFLAGGALTVAAGTPGGVPRVAGFVGLLALAAGAALLVVALRDGVVLDADGVTSGTGSRRPRRRPWGDVDALEVAPAGAGGVVVTLLDAHGVRTPLTSRPLDGATWEAALHAARDLDLPLPDPTAAG